MSNDEIQYELKEVRAVRGLVEQTRAKWEKDGWEYVSQTDGKLQSKLNFRRPKKKLPVKLIAIGGGAFAVILTTIIVIGTVSEANNKPASVAQPSTASSSPSVTASSTPTSTANPVITVQNNPEFAKLLSTKGTDLAAWQQFYDRYKGQTLEFDGNVGYMQDVAGTKYTVDMLIFGGNYSETSQSGPPFKVASVNVNSGFPMPKDGARTRLFQGDNIHVVAKLDDYKSKQELFFISLISTTLR